MNDRGRIAIHFFFNKLQQYPLVSCQYIPRLAKWEIINWVLKVIRGCFSFSFLRSMIGPENPLHSFNQSDAKLKPITTWSPAFSRALEILVVLLWGLTGSLSYFPFFRLVVVITVVLVWRISIEKCSKKLHAPPFRLLACLITLFSLTSVCIISILFSIHFLKCWQREFV